MKLSEKTKFISNWIKSYVDQMPVKAQSLVVGISGGIDSSVVSTLCALTGRKTIILSMPIKQIKSQHDLSLKHGEWLTSNYKNAEHKLIELEDVFNSFEKTLQTVINPRCGNLEKNWGYYKRLLTHHPQMVFGTMVELTRVNLVLNMRIWKMQ